MSAIRSTNGPYFRHTTPEDRKRIVALFLEGKSTKDICSETRFSETTIRNHIKPFIDDRLPAPATPEIGPSGASPFTQFKKFSGVYVPIEKQDRPIAAPAEKPISQVTTGRADFGSPGDLVTMTAPEKERLRGTTFTRDEKPRHLDIEDQIKVIDQENDRLKARINELRGDVDHLRIDLVHMIDLAKQRGNRIRNLEDQIVKMDNRIKAI